MSKARRRSHVEKFSFDRRIYNNTTSIFSKFTDTNLKLSINNTGECYIISFYDKKEVEKIAFGKTSLNVGTAEVIDNTYTINLNPYKSYFKTEKQFYRGLEHELAHLVFQTDYPTKHLFAKEMEKKFNKYGVQYKQAIDTFGIIEDHRIEHNWSLIFLGSMKYFKELREYYITCKPQDLTEMVLAARCEKEYLFEDFWKPFYHFIVDKLKMTENRSVKSTAYVGNLIFEEYIEMIKNFLNNKKSGNNQNQSKDNQKEQNQDQGNDSSQDNNDTDNDLDDDENDDDSEQSLEDYLDEMLDNKEFTDENDNISDEEVEDEIVNRFDESGINYSEETKLDFDLKIDIKEILMEEISDVLQDSLEEAQVIIDTIQEKLTTWEDPKVERNIELPVIKEKYFPMNTARQIPYYDSVNKLKQIFDRIELQNEIDTEDGEQGFLDTDLLIQSLISKQSMPIFQDEIEKEELVIALVIDGSGSMSGTPLDTAKRVGLTMKEAVKSYSSVQVDTWIYSGESDYTPIQKLSDGELAIVSTRGITHTNDAIRFVTQQPDYIGKKCLLFLVTDGMPMSSHPKYSKHVKTSSGKSITYVMADTHYAITDARKKGWKIFTFFIGNPMGNTGIFGSPFVFLKSGKELVNILDSFEAEVNQYLRK